MLHFLYGGGKEAPLRPIVGFLALIVIPFVIHGLEPLLFVIIGMIALTMITSFTMEILQVGRSARDDGTRFTSSATRQG